MILSENHIKKIILNEVTKAISSNPTEYDVIASFNKINKSFFKNKLPLCKFDLTLKKDYLGYFKYDGYKGNKLINPVLSVNSMYQYDSNQLDSVVGHEMIHYYLALYKVDPNCTHGTSFKQMASQMNSSLGLNVNETVDTGNMQYGQSRQNAQTPNSQIFMYMKSYMNSLIGYSKQLKNTSANTAGETLNFIEDLYNFTIALVDALNRCIAKKTLNEAGDITSTPTKMINDFMRGFRNWYHFVNNIFDEIIRNRSKYKHRNYYDNKGKLIVNQQMKLAELLYGVFPNIENKYNKINNKSLNTLSGIPCILNTMNVVNELKEKIDAEINNAQGNNP